VKWQERLNISANIPLNFVAVRQMTAEGQSDKMASDMEVLIKQRCGRIILRCIFRTWDVGIRTGLSWLRVATGGGHI
jgi:hypothetical protein